MLEMGVVREGEVFLLEAADIEAALRASPAAAVGEGEEEEEEGKM